MIIEYITDPEGAAVQALLDRLDPRLDEPCTVPDCVHCGARVHDCGPAELMAA
jgi:hypothetical protein